MKFSHLLNSISLAGVLFSCALADGVTLHKVSDSEYVISGQHDEAIAFADMLNPDVKDGESFTLTFNTSLPDAVTDLQGQGVYLGECKPANGQTISFERHGNIQCTNKLQGEWVGPGCCYMSDGGFNRQGTYIWNGNGYRAHIKLYNTNHCDFHYVNCYIWLGANGGHDCRNSYGVQSYWWDWPERNSP